MHLRGTVETVTYEVSWQVICALDACQPVTHQQQRDVWRQAHAGGQAGACTVSVLAWRTASKALAAFQACERGLRFLQTQGGLSGAHSQVIASCTSMFCITLIAACLFPTPELGRRCWRNTAAAHGIASVSVLCSAWRVCMY